MEKNKPLELALDLLKHSNIVCNNEYRFVTPISGLSSASPIWKAACSVWDSPTG